MTGRHRTHTSRDRQAARDALARLGIERLALSIHHASFPAGEDDLGHGTPYGRRGGELVAWAAALGFDAIALGPAGVTSRDNPSPYDATSGTRNPLHLAWGPLAAAGVVDAGELAAAIAARPAGDRVAYRHAWDAARRLLAPGAAPGAAEARADALVRAQHADLAARARGLGVALYADLPIGASHEERAALAPSCLPGYAMGAPPSRTNPAGQPWGYPVLDPRGWAPGGAARAVLAARLADLADHDGLRIDHPHGWVCPWVYRTGDPDPARAVRAGARLHESPAMPELADHPALAPLARVRADQIDTSRPRHDDAWVRALEPAQLDAYAVAFDQIVAALRARGRGPADLMVEVLSTCPRPLAAVVARHRLGRFRVTQKARVDEPDDVYRSDRARPEDWIMVGNHDTPPLRRVIDGWDAAERARRAAYLAARLEPDAAARPAAAARLAGDDATLATAMIADLFVGPARHVLVFWVDLFGSRAIYNRPGVVADDNWSLRVPADFEAAYGAARARGDAPALGEALAWALRARGLDRDDEGRALAAALLRAA